MRSSRRPRLPGGRPVRDSGHSNGSLSLWEHAQELIAWTRFQKPGFVAGEDDTAYRAVESGIPGRRLRLVQSPEFWKSAEFDGGVSNHDFHWSLCTQRSLRHNQKHPLPEWRLRLVAAVTVWDEVFVLSYLSVAAQPTWLRRFFISYFCSNSFQRFQASSRACLLPVLASGASPARMKPWPASL